MRKRLLSLALVLCLIISLLPTAAFADTTATSGTCGENVTWTLENGVLTISGTGEIADYDAEYDGENDYVTTAPWGQYYQAVTNVVIESGVTRIGAGAFYGCSSLTDITIADGVLTIGSSAFFGCSSLTGITIPASVTVIPDDAFRYCGSLASIDVDENNEYYCSEDGVLFDKLEGCKNYIISFPAAKETKEYRIPDGVRIISGYAFESCYNLTSVVIPDSVTDIRSWAFNECSSLTDITIPDSVTSIGSFAFNGCSGLESATIGSGITKIALGVFDGCSALRSINYHGTLEQWNAIEIDYHNDTLSACAIHCTDGDIESAEVTWTLEDGVLTISGRGSMDKYAYDTPWGNESESITSVVIESGVKNIAEYAFTDCFSVESVSIPVSVIDIEYRAFDGCTNLKEVYYEGTKEQWSAIIVGEGNGALKSATVTCSDGVVQPDYACGENVTWSLENGTLTISGTGAISDYDYNAPWDYAKGSITSLVVESGVTGIGSLAFYNLYALESVTLCADVANIGSEAFDGCTSLKEVNYAGTKEQWNAIAVDNGNSALHGATVTCSDVTVFPHGTCGENVTWTLESGTLTISGTGKMDDSYNDRPLWNSVKESITSVVIEDAVTNIGAGAFAFCYNLNSITIPASVTHIGSEAFDCCNNLTNVSYAGTKEQWSAITVAEGNSELASTRINCLDGDVYPHGTCGENLTWTLENGVLTISGTGEMDNYYSGESAKDAPWYDDAEAITSVVLESGVTSVGAGAFSTCSRLTSVTLPDGITSIGSFAFWECSKLKSITIPDGVTSIEYNAFYGCSSLENVMIPGGVTSIGDWAFSGCNSLNGINVDENNEVYCSDNGVLFDKAKTILIACPAGIKASEYRIPDGVTTICRNAFTGCGSLNSVIIPDGVTSIGVCAFNDCYNMEKIAVPQSVTSIGDEAFWWCVSLTTVDYAGTKEQWSAIAVGDGNDCLNEATIHCTDGDIEPVKSCGENVTWTLKNGTLTISGTGEMEDYYGWWDDGGSAPWFNDVEAVTAVVIESGVTGIGNYAFERCDNLTSVTIPETVTRVGTSAFNRCNKLSDVNYSGTLEQWNAIAIGEGNERLTACTIHCTDGDIYPHGSCGENLTWELKNGTLTISGEGAMDNFNDEDTSPWYGNSESITKLVIEPGVTGIGSCALCECSKLTDVTIPDSVTYIGMVAFRGCTSLTEVTYLGTKQQWIAIEAHGGNGCLTRSTIRCTNGNVDTAWKLADGVLTISGENVMPNYGWQDAPWTDDQEAISSIVVENGAIRIGDEAFGNCRNVKSITLPASVTYIGYYALPNANEPMDIYYSGTKAQWDKIDMISGELMMNSAVIHCTDGDISASDYCGNHVKWTLENGVLTISGAGDMYDYEEGQRPPWSSGTDEITSIVIESGVKSIGTYAFAGCMKAKSISIAEGVEEIGYGAFMNCSALKNAALPEGLVTVGRSIFTGCDCLESVTVPSTVTDGVADWFGHCPKLKNIIVDEQSGSFASVDGVLFNKDKTQILLYPVGREAESYQIPDGVMSIGQAAFEDCSSLKSVTIPDSVTGIAASAFYCCNSLTSAVIPDSVNYIGWNAFAECSALESVALPHSHATIDDGAFSGCTSLRTVTVPKTVSFEGNIFRGCTSLEAINIEEGHNEYRSEDGVVYSSGSNLKIYPSAKQNERFDIPEGVEGVSDYAFDNCSKLKTLTVPASVGYIGEQAFNECHSLTAIEVSEGNESYCSIDGVVFGKDKTRLFFYPTGRESAEYAVPDGVTEIWWLSFSNCTNLKSISIPTSVTYINSDAFEGCENLADVNYSGTKEQWNEIIINYDIDGLRGAVIHCSDGDIYPHGSYGEYLSYEFKDGTLTISGIGSVAEFYDTPWNSFRHRIINVVIENGVTEIDSFAFFGCNNMQSITIPETVTAIGNNAFGGCSSLKKVDFGGTVKQWSEISIVGENAWLTSAEITCIDSHTHHYTDTVTAPTCTEKGYTTHTCDCGDSYVDSYVDATGHSFGKWVQTKAPTCTENGSETRSCANCDETETREIAATGHHYTDTVTAPTCTEQGYTTHTCICGKSYVDSYVDATGHNYEKGVCTACGEKDPNYIAAPTLKITTSAGKPKISWNKIDGATKYKIYRSTDGKTYKYLTYTTKTSYTNSKATIGTTYYYKITAVIGGTESDFSNIKSVKCVPATPTLTISRVNGKPKLSWKAIDGASKYYIYRSTDGKTYKYYASTTKTSYTNTNVKVGTKYYYKVKAVAVVNKVNVGSAYSSAKSLLVSTAAPTVKITTSNGDPKISWSKVTGATKYYIYRSTDGKTYKYYTYTSKTAYTDTKAKAGTKYYYKVKAIAVVNKTNIASVYSNAVSIKAK